MTAVEVAGLTYIYPDGTPALQKLELKIQVGQRVALLGANGSGKTTLICHLIGLLLPQQGKVRVMGLEVNKANLQSIRQKVGLVFDNPDNQLFSTSVFEDVAFGPRNIGMSEEQVTARVQCTLKLVEMEQLAQRPPFNLSLGQKKRVAIAGVLAMEPAVLLLDEPLSGVDPRTANQLMSILQQLHSEGKTIIMATHDVDMAYAWADQVIIMNEGQVLAQGSSELLQQRDLMATAALEVPILAQVFAGTKHSPRTAKDAHKIIQTYLR